MSNEEKKGRGRPKSFDHVIHLRLTPADLARVRQLGEGATDAEKLRDLVKSALILRSKKAKRLRDMSPTASAEIPDTEKDRK